MTLRYTMTNDNITIFVDGKSLVTPDTAANFAGLQQALFTKNWARARELATPARAVIAWAKGDWAVDEEAQVISYKGTELPKKLNDRIFRMISEAPNSKGWVNFWERLQKNPSYRSVESLYDFMAHSNIPVTEDGMIMAYKSVASNYKDHHSGTIDNTPGKTISMPRNKISDDPRTACHEGLHVGAYEYANTFRSGGIIVLCEIDPEDVVCVPYDCSSMKMRCCKYKVIKLMKDGDDLMPSSVYVPDAAEKPSKGGYTPAACGGDDDDDEDYGDDEDYDDEDDCDPPTIAEEEAEIEDAEIEAEMADLRELNIGDLRKVAGRDYGIVGASKIPGGKQTLLDRIEETLRNPAKTP